MSWRSKKQTVVVLSTAEAEYVALAAAAQEAEWLHFLVKSLHQSIDQPTVIYYEDNQSTLAIANNNIQHGRTKHIDIKYHYTKDLVAAGKVHLHYCPTTEMVADALTKPLQKDTFEKHKSDLGVTSCSP